MLCSKKGKNFSSIIDQFNTFKQFSKVVEKLRLKSIKKKNLVLKLRCYMANKLTDVFLFLNLVFCWISVNFNLVFCPSLPSKYIFLLIYIKCFDLC